MLSKRLHEVSSKLACPVETANVNRLRARAKPGICRNKLVSDSTAMVWELAPRNDTHRIHLANTAELRVGDVHVVGLAAG
jgi:hypothetical protein